MRLETNLGSQHYLAHTAMSKPKMKELKAGREEEGVPRGTTPKTGAGRGGT